MVAEQEDDSLAERLEAYKMVRRIEPELPPLTKDFQFRIQRPEQGIVTRNSMPETCLRFSPEMRRMELQRRRQEREKHQHAVASQRMLQLTEVSGQYAEVLARKRMQAEAALASRRNPNRKQSKRFAVDRWLTICVITSWLQSRAEDLEVQKMDMMARINYVEKNAHKSRRSSSVVLKQVAFWGQIFLDQKVTQALRVLTCIMRKKQRVMEKRRQARTVYSILAHWQVAGPFFVGIKQLAWQIRKLQVWWRQCARRLHGLRDGISKRWDKLERKEVFSDLAKDRGVKVRGMKKISEAEIQQELIPEATRLQFLEQELRARRYFMLPQIYLCEEDTRKFQKHAQSVIETRNVHRAMGLKPPDTIPTYVGMDRPSHLPPAHLQSEARGGACPEWCLGRKGDEEILTMIRVARRNRESGRGWTEIMPQRRRSSVRASAKAVANSSSDGRRERHTAEQASPFGDTVGDEELKKWGASPEEMPLLRSGRPVSAAPQS